MKLAFRLLMGRYKVTCRPGSHTTDRAARRAWGCDERAEFPVFPDPHTGSFQHSAHLDLHRCPACQVGSEWTDLVHAWAEYGAGESRGPLPVAGGWMDQTQWFADAHAILSDELSKHRRLQAEQARR